MLSSQSGSKTVPVSFLKNVKNKIEQCDSLKVAHFSCEKDVDSIIKANNHLHTSLDSLFLEETHLKKDLDKANANLNKTRARKPQDALRWGLIGALVVLLLK